MKRTLHKALSMLLTAAMVLSMGIFPAFAEEGTPAESYETWSDEARFGPGESHAEGVAPVEITADDPKPEDESAPAPMMDGFTAKAPTFVHNGVFCNGTPAVIKQDADGQTYLTTRWRIPLLW